MILNAPQRASFVALGVMGVAMSLFKLNYLIVALPNLMNLVF